MVWFLVDDNLAFHKKVTSAGNAAMGCWVRAGAWATHNGTDGFIPDHMARQIGTMSQWTSLVTSGLAERQIGGYLYHDWFDVQPSKACVDQRRKRERERKAEQRKRKNVPGGVPADVPTPSPPTPPPPPARGGGVNSPARAREAPSGATSAESARAASTPQFNQFQEIANCDLCDDDGRKPNGMVCDHIDRRFTNAHGLKNVRETMGWKT